MSSDSAKRNPPGSWLPGVLISVVVIVAFIFLIDWQEFGKSIQQIRPMAILLLFVLTVLPLITRSLAWRSLLNDQISLRDAFFGENIGYLLNNFLPLRLGEIARGFLLSEKVSGGFAAVLPSIFLERLIDLGMAALTLLVSIPFIVSESWMLPTVLAALAVVLVGIGFLYLAVRQSSFLEKLVTKLFARIPKLQQSLLSLLRQFVEGLSSAVKGKNFLRAILFLLVTWSGYLISYYVMVASIAPDAKFIWALFINGVVAMGIAIPSAPGSLGIWEASFVAALAVFGVQQSKSLAVAIVMHLMSYLVTGVFGMLGFIVFGSSLNSLVQQVRQHRQQGQQTKVFQEENNGE